jgi:hypothetical protein
MYFIPAGVGNAITGTTARITTSVHPRGCGERYYHFGARAKYTGSSPRLRGIAAMEARIAQRFIPAVVGNATDYI